MSHPGRHVADAPGGGSWRWGAPAQGPKRRLAPKRSLTLTDEAWAALGRLAGPGGSRSAAVERLALAAVRAAATTDESDGVVDAETAGET